MSALISQSKTMRETVTLMQHAYVGCGKHARNEEDISIKIKKFI
jgi:hypothetical protein